MWNLRFEDRLACSRFAQVPLCNLGRDALTTMTDVLFGRTLQVCVYVYVCVMWWEGEWVGFVVIIFLFPSIAHSLVLSKPLSSLPPLPSYPLSSPLPSPSLNLVQPPPSMVYGI
jgi:Domain of unknown function (DUF1744)